MITRMGIVKSRLLLGGAATAGGGAVVWALSAVFLAATPNCASEPLPRCVVQSNEAIAKYTAIGPPTGANCSNWVLPWLAQNNCSDMNGNDVCQAATAGTVVGEPVGLQTYFPNPNDTNQNEEPGSMAFKSEYIGTLIQGYLQGYGTSANGGAPADFNPNYPYAPGLTAKPAGQPPQVTGSNFVFNWGKFDTVYPVNGVCTISNITESNVTYPAIPQYNAFGSSPAMPGPFSGMAQTTIDYKWTSPLKVIVDDTTGAIGDQVFGDLTISQDGCSQSFHVAILAPRVQCNATDDAGNITGGDQSQCGSGSQNPDDIGMNTPDATTQAQLYGSGILPGIPVNCQSIVPGPLPAADGGATSAPTPDFECLLGRSSP